jgi:hypothetical protein
MRNDKRAGNRHPSALFRICVIDWYLILAYTISMSSAIKFSDEKIVLLLIRANQKKFCPLAARVIQTLSAK